MRNRWLAVGVAGALLPIGFGVSAAVATPGSAVTAESAATKPVQAAKKKKKGKQKQKDTATVDATWTVKRSGELKGGIESEELTVKLTDAEATFANDTDTSASGKAKVSLTYRAHFFTDNPEWWQGCETIVIDSTATFSGKLGFHVYATNTRTEKGSSERLANGWAVELDRPTEQFRMVTTGTSQAWDSPLLQEECQVTSVNEPLGWWSQYFVGSNSATGKLNGGGKGVILTNVYSRSGHSYVIDGKIKFSDSVEKRGRKVE